MYGEDEGGAEFGVAGRDGGKEETEIDINLQW